MGIGTSSAFCWESGRSQVEEQQGREGPEEDRGDNCPAAE